MRGPVPLWRAGSPPQVRELAVRFCGYINPKDFLMQMMNLFNWVWFCFSFKCLEFHEKKNTKNIPLHCLKVVTPRVFQEYIYYLFKLFLVQCGHGLFLILKKKIYDFMLVVMISIEQGQGQSNRCVKALKCSKNRYFSSTLEITVFETLHYFVKKSSHFHCCWFFVLFCLFF